MPSRMTSAANVVEVRRSGYEHATVVNAVIPNANSFDPVQSTPRHAKMLQWAADIVVFMLQRKIVFSQVVSRRMLFVTSPLGFRFRRYGGRDLGRLHQFADISAVVLVGA